MAPLLREHRRYSVESQHAALLHCCFGLTLRRSRRRCIFTMPGGYRRHQNAGHRNRRCERGKRMRLTNSRRFMLPVGPKLSSSTMSAIAGSFISRAGTARGSATPGRAHSGAAALGPETDCRSRARLMLRSNARVSPSRALARPSACALATSMPAMPSVSPSLLWGSSDNHPPAGRRPSSCLPSRAAAPR